MGSLCSVYIGDERTVGTRGFGRAKGEGDDDWVWVSRWLMQWIGYRGRTRRWLLTFSCLSCCRYEQRREMGGRGQRSRNERTVCFFYDLG